MGLQHALIGGFRSEETLRGRATHPLIANDGQTDTKDRYIYVPGVQGPLQIRYPINYWSLN